MSKQHHYLKIVPKYYLDVEHGVKTFEIRKNDRDYHVGDILHLQEWTESNGYSDRELGAEVIYMVDDPEYCKEGYVVLGIKLFDY